MSYGDAKRVIFNFLHSLVRRLLRLILRKVALAMSASSNPSHSDHPFHGDHPLLSGAIHPVL